MLGSIDLTGRAGMSVMSLLGEANENAQLLAPATREWRSTIGAAEATERARCHCAKC
jgi:hypothetical protein